MAKLESISVPTSTEGEIPRGFYSAGVFNNGSTDALFNGIPLPAGASVSLPAAPSGDYSENIPYNSQSSTLLIHIIR